MLKNSAIPTNAWFIGRVMSYKSEEGYGFIAIGSVAKEDGNEHGLPTDHDIFIHRDECTAPLRAGLELRFQVAADVKRGNGCYRAQGAEPYAAEVLPGTGTPIPGLSIVAKTQGQVALLEQRSPHYGMKEVPAGEVAKAAANQPLKDVPREEPEPVTLTGDPSQLADILSTYLFTQFPGLQNLGLDHRVVGFDPAAEERLVNEAVSGYHEMGMEDQVQLTLEEYRRYQAMRKFLGWILGQGWLLPGAKVSPAVIGSLVACVRDLPDSGRKDETITRLQQVFGFMGERHLLRPSTVLPLRYLPDLFMAAPVWFFDLGTATELEMANGALTKASADPQVHPAVKDICELLPGNPRWADAFQMFNRRCRPIRTFKGDIIPPAIIRLIREARGVFDRVVILTPYLDLPGADWMDLEWIRSIDPYVVGFKKGVPAFFVLGRFSDTGVFPLLDELTADTMRFLQENSQKLLSFDAVQNPYWFYPRGTAPRNTDRLGTRLVAVAAEMLCAYEAGHLFDWLRNEWTEEFFSGTRFEEPAQLSQ